MNKVEIKICGQAGVGKSTITKIVYDALKSKGFQVGVFDPDVGIDDSFFSDDYQKMREESVREMSYVSIENVSVCRSSLE